MMSLHTIKTYGLIIFLLSAWLLAANQAFPKSIQSKHCPTAIPKRQCLGDLKR